MRKAELRGIVLAGGTGTRFHPVTKAVSKQLLPVYNKPLIYYPLSVLMIAGIRDIAIITTPRDLPMFRDLLGDGSQWGVNFEYFPQEKPEGIAQAFLIAEDFIKGYSTALVLGDNLFFGEGLGPLLDQAIAELDGATIFPYHVHDPKQFGVVEFDTEGRVLSIEEKPKVPKSPYAATGLYFYDKDVVDVTKTIEPSARNELEITDVNRVYLEAGRLKARIFGRGFAWLDTGTPSGLLEASSFVATIERRQNFMIASLEEIAWRQRWISDGELDRLARQQSKTEYGRYLSRLLAEKTS